MPKIPAVKSVMTPFPYAVGPGASLAVAERLMVEHDIRHLPVRDGDELLGVISDRELDRQRGSEARREDRPVSGVMSREPYTVDLETPLDVVLLTMAERHLDCAVVLRETKVVGIFTTTDACRAFGERLRRLRTAGGDDAA